MWIVDVDAQEPGLPGWPVLGDEFDSGVRRPRCLVELGRRVVLSQCWLDQASVLMAWIVLFEKNRFRFNALVSNPGRVSMLIKRPVMPRGVAVLKISITVIYPGFASARSSSEVQLANEAPVVSGISEFPCYEVFRHCWMDPRISVPRVVYTTWIHPRQETRSARCADGTLAERVCECRTLSNELVKVRCSDVRIAESTDGVKALLIGAVPQNIWALRIHVGDGIGVHGQAVPYRTLTVPPRMSLYLGRTWHIQVACYAKVGDSRPGREG